MEAKAGDLTISLPMIPCDSDRETVMKYFQNTWNLTEVLFSSLKEDKVFYEVPDALRRPLIFYYAHVAVFFVNKFREANIISEEERINPHYETMFAIGVDEMSWDDMGMNDHFDWPPVEDVREYRRSVKALVEDKIKSVEYQRPISWEQPYWAVLMGMEHERIHLETSTVLFRQLATDMLVRPASWPANGPVSDAECKNEMISVETGTVTFGKPVGSTINYGWDVDHGQKTVQVPAFQASKYLITQREFLEFVKSGGYENRKYWTDEGWRWARFVGRNHPLFWVPTDDGNFRYRTVYEVIDMPWNWPVDVNYLEAEAYCRWKGTGFRLITEPEWHRMRGDAELEKNEDFIMKEDFPYNINFKYATSTPVNHFEPTSAGFYDVHGNVWEWSSDHNDALPGYRTHPYYFDFSTPCFDGRHNMIMGGSWISTGNEASIYARYAFRRHFFQHCGFRLARTTVPYPKGNAGVFGIADQPHRLARNNWVENDWNPYESKRSLYEYLLMHYGKPNEVMPHDFGPTNGLEYPKRCSEEVINACAADKSRALDLGCAVGRSSFELAREFKEVVGIDFSASFIRAAQEIAEKGTMAYKIKEEGYLWNDAVAEVDEKLDRSRLDFQVGDACNLDVNALGQFQGVLLANLLDRLPEPMKCLKALPKLVAPGGVLVITTPLTWLHEYTEQQNWLGGFTVKGKEVRSLDTIKSTLAESFDVIDEKKMPFVIREHIRKFQWSVATCTIFKRKL